MKKLIVNVLFVAGLLSASFGAACDKKVGKLRAVEYELGMIHHALQGNNFTASAINLAYALNDYSISCGKVDDCARKLKPKYKKIFQSKGLQWNETNIEAEYQKAKTAREQAEESCEASKKRDILD